MSDKEHRGQMQAWRASARGAGLTTLKGEEEKEDGAARARGRNLEVVSGWPLAQQRRRHGGRKKQPSGCGLLRAAPGHRPPTFPKQLLEATRGGDPPGGNLRPVQGLPAHHHARPWGAKKPRSFRSLRNATLSAAGGLTRAAAAGRRREKDSKARWVRRASYGAD